MTAMIAATTIGTSGFLFTSELLLQRKTVQERQPPRDHREAAQHEQYAKCDQQSAAGYFNSMHMKLKPVIELQEARDSQHHGQDRSHTGGPSESECEPDHESSPDCRATFETVQPRIRQQCFDLKDACQMQTEQNDH